VKYGVQLDRLEGATPKRVYERFHTGRNINFRVTSAMKIQVPIFWVVTPCSVMGGHQRFGGPCCLHLQSEKFTRATEAALRTMVDKGSNMEPRRALRSKDVTFSCTSGDSNAFLTLRCHSCFLTSPCLSPFLSSCILLIRGAQVMTRLACIWETLSKISEDFRTSLQFAHTNPVVTGIPTFTPVPSFHHS